MNERNMGVWVKSFWARECGVDVVAIFFYFLYPVLIRYSSNILQKEFEKRVDPNDKTAQTLLDEMRQHIKKVSLFLFDFAAERHMLTLGSFPLQLEDMRKNEDPRLSFSTPEFKEAQRTFTDAFKKNFGKPVEWALVKDYAWSTPQLRKLDNPVDVNGNPWPLDSQGNPK